MLFGGLRTRFDYVPDVMWPARLENLPVMADARIGMAVTRARPMAAAMRAYSIAVAPDSSFAKRLKLFIFNLRESGPQAIGLHTAVHVFNAA